MAYIQEENYPITNICHKLYMHNLGTRPHTNTGTTQYKIHINTEKNTHRPDEAG